MADRVHYLAGLAPGSIDHVPVSWFTRSASIDQFQVVADIREMCNIYWVVKRWRVYGSVTRVVGATTFGPYSWDYTTMLGDDDSGSPTNPSHELQLVPLPLWTIFQSDNPGTEDGGQVSLEMFTANWLRSGPEFRPLVEFIIYAGAVGAYTTSNKGGSNNAASGITAKIRIPHWSSYGPGSGVTLTDHSLAMYKPDTDSSTMSGTFTVEPYEYWPHETQAGNPVYNASTGAIINTPD